MTIALAQPATTTSILQVVQNAANRIGVNPPAALVGSTDAIAIQMLALANAEIRGLASGQSVGRNYDWQALTTEVIFVTVAAESQGKMSILAPGFKFLINDTIWNRDLIRPIPGALTTQDWQLLKSSSVKGPWNMYRIHGGYLQMIPSPPAGQTCAFEYQSIYAVTDAAQANLKATYTADTDLTILDSTLVEDGLVWRWKQAKGFDFGNDFQMYQTTVINYMARDGGKPHINMGNSDSFTPFLLIPEGSWGH